MTPKVVAFGFDEGAIAEYRMRMPMRETAHQGLIDLRAEDNFLARKIEPGEEVDPDAQGPTNELLEKLGMEETYMRERMGGADAPVLGRQVSEEALRGIQEAQAVIRTNRPKRTVNPDEAAANQKRYDGWAEGADLLFTQRYVEGERGRLYQRLSRPQGIPWVLDIDDQVMALDRENPGFHGYAAKAPADLGECREIADVSEQQDGEVCMKHRKTGQIMAIKLKQEYPRGLTYAQIMGADAIICGTEELRKYYRKLRRKEHPASHAYTIPYSISTKAWSGLKQPEHDGEIRVGWLGADSHHREMAALGAIAEHVLAKYPKVRFYWKSTMNENLEAYFRRHKTGCVYTPLLEATEKYGARCVRIREWVPHDEWPQFYADINLDIILAPLADTEFRRCVSPIKWVEAAMIRKPCVCSEMPGYQDVIKQWQNGVLCGKPKQWFKSVDRLIESKDRRDAIGGRAHEKAMAGFSMEKNAGRYAEVFEKVVTDLGQRARDRAKEMAA